MNTVACRGLSNTLFDVMDWEDNTKYRLRGRYIENGETRCMVFGLEMPEMTRIEEIVVPPTNQSKILTSYPRKKL